MIRRLLPALLARLLPLVPPDRRDLVHAALAEAESIPSGADRRAWLAGTTLWTLRCLATARRITLMTVAVGGPILLCWVDLHSGRDIGAQESMALLLMLAFTGGALAGVRRAWAPALPLGLALSVTHLAVGDQAGLALSLTVLLVPATFAGYAGAALSAVVVRR
jgi:hypothetical protein